MKKFNVLIVCFIMLAVSLLAVACGEAKPYEDVFNDFVEVCSVSINEEMYYSAGIITYENIETITQDEYEQSSESNRIYRDYYYTEHNYGNCISNQIPVLLNWENRSIGIKNGETIFFGSFRKATLIEIEYRFVSVKVGDENLVTIKTFDNKITTYTMENLIIEYFK